MYLKGPSPFSQCHVATSSLKVTCHRSLCLSWPISGVGPGQRVDPLPSQAGAPGPRRRVLASLGSVAASSIRPGVPRESPERPPSLAHHASRLGSIFSDRSQRSHQSVTSGLASATTYW